MGVQGSDDFIRNLRGVLGITAFHVGCIGQTLRTIMFNVYFRPDGVTTNEENKLYFRKFEIFPGFRGLMRSLVSASTILLVILVFSAILIGV